jgi:hypothetical protein
VASYRVYSGCGLRETVLHWRCGLVTAPVMGLYFVPVDEFRKADKLGVNRSSLLCAEFLESFLMALSSSRS